MTVLDTILSNIRRYQHYNVSSNFDNTYGQLILDFSINDTTFLPEFIKGSVVLPKIDRSEYDSLSIVMGISDYYSFKTVAPVMKECFHWGGHGKKIEFNGSCVYSAGGIILDSQFNPLFMLGKNWEEEQDGNYTCKNVCKVSPDIFRQPNTINRFIRDKLIPLFAEDSRYPWKDACTVEIDYGLANYIKTEISPHRFDSELSKDLLSHYIEHTFEKADD